MKDEMTIKEARKIAHEAMRKLDEHIDYINSGRILEDLGELKLSSCDEFAFFVDAEKKLEALEKVDDEACRDVARIKRRNKKLRRNRK
jgi:DNA polymerase elongation subunit (family B)